VAGADVVVRAETPLPLEIPIEGTVFAFRLSADSLAVEVLRDGVPAVSLPLDTLQALLEEGRGDPAGGTPAPVELRRSGEGLEVTAWVRSAAARRADGGIRIHHVVADFVLRIGE
jgi:hypothetical protein